MTRLERLTEHMSIEEVASLVNKATPEEKVELEKILKKKRVSLKNVSAERKKKIDELFKE
jgi:division protein CdvB (Snf7/Vps24/ESCRT-III family)